MRTVEIKRLQPIEELTHPILHVPSGMVLLQKGETLDVETIEALKESGVEKVALLDGNESPDSVRSRLTRIEIPLETLQAGDQVAHDVYDDRGRILIREGAKIPNNFIPLLQKRGIMQIHSFRSKDELQEDVARAARGAIQKKRALDSQIIDEEKVEVIQKIELEEAAKEDFNETNLRRKIDKLQKIECLPQGSAFGEMVEDTRTKGPISSAERKIFTDIVEESLDTIRSLFEDLNHNARTVNTEDLDNLVTRAMAGLIRNRDLLMLMGMHADPADYGVHHALATMVVAINIGTTLDYDPAQIKNLGYGALLADVGMLRVPEGIRQKPARLDMREQAEVRRHPGYGLDILQEVRNLPNMVPYVVFQCHERSNGSGYPCGKKEVVIHPFARIVGVADIYTSFCADRPYRPARMPYEAMEMLLRMCGKRLLNRQVLQAFLQCNSLVPVGSFVRMTDGSVGQVTAPPDPQEGNGEMLGRVVAANPEDYTRPLVTVIWDAQMQPLPQPKRVNLLQSDDIKIAQALAPSDLGVETDFLVGF